ncbi:thioredoxin family protein [Candidatus Gracilibacteria bacterium]|nr:thioredoxin family protein [Candidatus Gracilibacteria bacterium]
MKKTTLIFGLITSSILVSGVSAMKTMDGGMMHKDTMMTASGTIIKKETMMDMSKMSLQAIVNHHGYNWSKDRKKLAMMAGITNYRGTVKQNLMIRAYLLSDIGMKDAMMKKDSMVNTTDTMMKKDEMKKDESKVLKKAVGMYTPYSSTAVSSALAEGKTVYLFFAASWCPACRSLDSSITGNMTTIPENTVIFKVDYDNSTDLKKQYAVTMQHTVVKLNKDASLMKKIIGPTSIADIIK